MAVAELETDLVCTTHVDVTTVENLKEPESKYEKNATPGNSQSSGYLFVLGGG